jgi:hypothetical protein
MECTECEMALYCYSEASTWIFRTTEEMAERLTAIDSCPYHSEILKAGATTLHNR